MDYHSDVALIKNNTSSPILIAMQPDELMTDSILYNRRFSEYYIEAHQSGFTTIPNERFDGLADSDMAYLYVFNDDSVYEYLKLKRMQGIVKHSFIRKIAVQLNKVKEPLDTIYISKSL